MEVIVIGGDIDRALRAFKKIIARDGIFRRLKERQEGIKPSVRRRNKKRKALRRLEKLRVRKDGHG